MQVTARYIPRPVSQAVLSMRWSQGREPARVRSWHQRARDQEHRAATTTATTAPEMVNDATVDTPDTSTISAKPVTPVDRLPTSQGWLPGERTTDKVEIAGES